MSSDPSQSSTVLVPKLRIIRQLIEKYDGSVPLHRYLKDTFRSNRHFGSRDRKIYSDWVFAWFRIGKSITDIGFEERITVAIYLTNGMHQPMIAEAVHKFIGKAAAEWEHENGLIDRIGHVAAIYPSFRIADIFSFHAHLSNAVKSDTFYLSHVRKPLVWVRLFPDSAAEFMRYCNEQQISFETHAAISTAIGFPPAFNIDQTPFRKSVHYEVQDLSSQICGAAIPAKSGEYWWDCCCGAGGKSLQLLHRIPGIRIFATDVRASVIENFKLRLPSRFAKQVSVEVANLTAPYIGRAENSFDGIYADVPCSGSGTWSRTPEYLAYFNEDLLQTFRTNQELIVTEALKQLKPGGTLVYMTCSVFEIENEGMVAFVLQNQTLSLVHSELVVGCESGSDSMFYAVFRKK